MKRSAVILGALVTATAFPASASAATDCSTATSSQVNTGPGPVVLYADANGGGGLTGTADVSAGACADGLNLGGGQLDGGVAEVGAKQSGQAYAVVDGDDTNTGGSGQAGGYVGVSNFESGGKDPDCDGNDEGSGSNSGGCFTLRNPVDRSTVVAAPVPLVVCGNTSGKSFEASDRDGCSIP